MQCPHHSDSPHSQAKVVPAPLDPPLPKQQSGSLAQCFLSRETRQVLRRAATERWRQGQYRAALTLLNHLLHCDPHSAEDYSNRGLVRFSQGQMAAALADYNQAIALNPRLAAAFNNRGNYFAHFGAFSSALVDYDQAINLNPLHIQARINRAVTYREQRQYDEALVGLNEALLFDRLLGLIYAERGRTYHLQGDWNGAIADYRCALTCWAYDRDRPTAGEAKTQQVQTWLHQLQSA